MYARTNGAQTYLAQQVMNDTPAARVALLYERALASLNEAIFAIKEGDVERRCNANRRVMEILSVLSQTLDMDRGGEIATNLDRLYEFCLQRLQQVDHANSIEAAENVISVLRPLHESWRQLADGVTEQAAEETQARSAATQPGGAEAMQAYAASPRRMSVSA